MSAEEFLEAFRFKMLDHEIEELEAGTFETIYFGGLITDRNAEDVPVLREILEER